MTPDDDAGLASTVRGPQDLTSRDAQRLITDGNGSRYNEDALLYYDHTVNYPQHLRRRYWVETARRSGVVIRDDPSGPVPCTHGHECCSAVSVKRGGGDE